MRDQDLRVLLEKSRDFDRGYVLGNGIEALQIAGAEKEVDLADRQLDAIIRVWSALNDGHVEVVFAVSAVGERLIKAAVLGFRHPIGAEGDLVERLRAGACRGHD